MSHWWIHLSVSHAALVLLLIAIAITVLGIAIGKCCAINEPPPPRPQIVRDYSAEYQQKREWLGDRHLLAKDINRRVTR